MGIKQRCCNKKSPVYKWYGRRGIRMHVPWMKSFIRFRDDIERILGSRPSQSHSLDRKKRNGHYVPGNLRWATPTVQQNNRRNNIRLLYRGRRVTVSELAEVVGVKRSRLMSSLRAPVSVEVAIARVKRREARLAS
jgi:hypothetical protein